jgi:cellulose synthase/poly-beta-1,6-N-acetylglucosamine synthase-like glycosyltransferase
MAASTILAVLFWTAWAIIAYTYVVFPILLALCAKLFGKAPSFSAPISPVPGSLDDATLLPRVAMVVAAYNEEQVLAEKLRNTWDIEYPADRFQLYIGSDGSSDGTEAILRSCTDPRLHAYCFTDRRGKISVLNELLEHVDADIVVMSDANTIYSPNAVKELVKHFEDPTVGCVSGELRLAQKGGVSGEGIYWKYEQWIKRSESRLGFLIGSNGAVFALRRELYQPLPSSTIIEDFVLTMRVIEQGYCVRFAPEARVVEPPCATSHAEMVRKIRIGAGGFQALGLTRRLLSPRYGLCAFAFWGHKVVRWLVPQCLLAALCANVGLARSPLYAGALALQIGGMALGVVAYKAPAGRKTPKWSRPITYFYLMNYALFLGFLRFLFRTQRVTWDRAPAAAQVLNTTAVVRTPAARDANAGSVAREATSPIPGQ